jgi:hypothetical protein
MLTDRRQHWSDFFVYNRLTRLPQGDCEAFLQSGAKPVIRSYATTCARRSLGKKRGG